MAIGRDARDRLAIERIDHVAINVTDVARARGFYEGVLGLMEVPRPRSFDFPGVWYRLGNMDLHLVGRSAADAESKRHFAFWVADVHAAARIMQAAGYPVNWEAHKIDGVERFFVADPDRNRLEFQGPD